MRDNSLLRGEHVQSEVNQSVFLDCASKTNSMRYTAVALFVILCLSVY